ncbi:MAG: hypothetical protein AABY15_00695 [Nanoarchaeota archaeon]
MKFKLDKKIENYFKNQNKILERWVIKNYGKRCSDYEKECVVCKKWKLFDKLILR